MTEVRRIVSNTGPLISLEKLRQGYAFIRQLYNTIIIPPGVLVISFALYAARGRTFSGSS